MIVRVRTSEGMYRLQVDSPCTLTDLRRALAQFVDASLTRSTKFYRDATYQSPLATDSSQPLGLQHGDMVFARLPEVITIDGDEDESNVSGEASTTRITPDGVLHPALGSSVAGHPGEPSVTSNVVELPVDTYLESRPGLIPRERDTKFCTHSDKGMCDYCMPLEPYDPAYLDGHGIKHLSFHSYLRQQTASMRAVGADPNGMGVTVSTQARGAGQLQDGKRVIPPPLEEPDFKVKVPCPAGHPAWPVSICTKCQPSTITLQRQAFRFVDHLSFATAELVDRFIQFWRQTGTQRFGYLYGHYEPYLKVPLGVQAVVEAIVEPPQTDATDGIKADMTWDGLDEVDRVAGLCGLTKVGMIFTDLSDDGEGQGKVMCKRHVGTYFMTSLECTFAAQMQLRHPNPCRWSASGQFGSKFVTCVVSGNGEGGIDLAAYQMSTTAMAMCDADIIEPTVDPGQIRVKPAVKPRYVPDILYKFKNEYGVTVSKNAKPTFPVEYLLTTVTHGFPDQPDPRFITPEPFPIGNRPTQGHVSEATLVRHLIPKSSTADDTSSPVAAVPGQLSDFHLLTHIANLHLLGKDELALLARVATTRDPVTYAQLEATSGWQNLATLLREAAGTPSDGSARNGGGAESEFAKSAAEAAATSGGGGFDRGEDWICRHCTYHNPSMLSECEMCLLPRDQ
ncbi:nuclear protein localization protein 4 [Tieghemiomyces parasiticus]|uniref:Nuclear protein localization protein 4 n=1 Tax=Tieghemiomyces parasiticus TaxID=78921 RepID=A0A9W8A897_9FUNG|nr:nuclear protein localization protein 4 [Tieghemiomyces parasiticus]